MFFIKSQPTTQHDNWVYHEDINCWINQSTGEYRANMTINVMEGSQVLSPEEICRRQVFWEKEKEHRQALEEDLEKGHQRFLWRSSNPHFIFVSTEPNYIGLSPATVARLIYLGTYMSYDDGKLRVTERIPLKRADLPKIMNLSPALITGFWKEVKDKYIIEDSSGQLSMPETVMRRGRFSSGDGTYQRFYIEAVRTLYGKTPARKHKHLGYVFQMLPFINHEFNILCHNPTEKDLDKIIPITLNEFCTAIGYDIENRSRLLKAYAKATFPVGNHQEPFCSFVSNGTDLDTARIYVNPHVLYRGDSYEQVQVLGKFCEPTSFCESSSFCESGSKNKIPVTFGTILPS